MKEIIKKVYFNGEYVPVLVIIDKFEGPPEIEFQGPINKRGAKKID